MSESSFRIFFGLLWLLQMGVRLHFQRQVKGMGDYVRVNERKEKFFFRLVAMGYLLLVFYVATPWLDFAHLPLPGWSRAAGGAVTGMGIGLLGWAHQALGRNWTVVLALSRSHELVTRGPYRHVRHPMYSAFFVIGVGFLLLSANWLVGAVYLAPLGAMYLTRVSAEETMMLERFGDGYRQYMQKTGRLWPRLGG